MTENEDFVLDTDAMVPILVEDAEDRTLETTTAEPLEDIADNTLVRYTDETECGTDGAILVRLDNPADDAAEDLTDDNPDTDTMTVENLLAEKENLLDATEEDESTKDADERADDETGPLETTLLRPLELPEDGASDDFGIEEE